MRAMQGDKTGPAPDVSGVMRALIQKRATEEQVIQIAEKIELEMNADEAVRREIYRIATAVSGGGKLSDYGIPKAQEYLSKWAKASKESGDAQPAPTKTPVPANAEKDNADKDKTDKDKTDKDARK